MWYRSLGREGQVRPWVRAHVDGNYVYYGGDGTGFDRTFVRTTGSFGYVELYQPCGPSTGPPPQTLVEIDGTVVGVPVVGCGR